VGAPREDVLLASCVDNQVAGAVLCRPHHLGADVELCYGLIRLQRVNLDGAVVETDHQIHIKGLRAVLVDHFLAESCGFLAFCCGFSCIRYRIYTGNQFLSLQLDFSRNFFNGKYPNFSDLIVSGTD